MLLFSYQTCCINSIKNVATGTSRRRTLVGMINDRKEFQRHYIMSTLYTRGWQKMMKEFQ